MKKTNYATLIVLLLLTLGLTACKPSTPVDEVQNKNHDDPKKIELIPVSYTHLTLPTILLV